MATKRPGNFAVRWCLLLLLGALSLRFGWHFVSGGSAPGYRSVPLVQGSQAVGSRLAGIAVDPSRHDVYAVVGGNTNKEAAKDFFILWRTSDGERCGLRVFDCAEGSSTLYQLRPDGNLPTANEFTLETAESPGFSQSNQPALTHAAVRSIVEALPEGFHLFGKP